jgi:protein-S-isoprenylcysteine O-methyltransferase Ste14
MTVTRSLELKIPPVAVVLALGAGMWGITRLFPSLTAEYPGRVLVAIALAVLGVAVAIYGVIEFRRARTTVDPRDPGKSTAVVTSGIYGFTRNPMYLGFLLSLVSWSIYLSNLYVVLGPVIFVLYMNRFQIAPEERILSARFGGTYDAYKTAVRRWL